MSIAVHLAQAGDPPPEAGNNQDPGERQAAHQLPLHGAEVL